ncbi:oligoribonuclease, mitochondrial [[Candida] anglica]|uniref:Oligoribonuclease, mitochondrial n=1 Tax=[Candida] anglica TaxID=148631 RepID=A0ABP0EEX1_9ASCO
MYRVLRIPRLNSLIKPCIPSSFRNNYPLHISFRSSMSTNTESAPKRVKLNPSEEESTTLLTTPVVEPVETTGAGGQLVDTKEVSKDESQEKKQSSVWKPLVWVDCEMTGLNVYEDNIIEICCLITDGHLNLIDEVGYESTIYVPKEKLDAMDQWCLDHHGASGLIEKVLTHKEKTIEVVQDELMEYLKKHIDPNKGLLSGNSIHMDKFFMYREMPKVIDYLHYRIVDVSSLMEIGFRHNPALMKKFPKKKGAHTARSDIMESIAQLRWYTENYLVTPTADEVDISAKNEDTKSNIEQETTTTEIPVEEKTL